MKFEEFKKGQKRNKRKKMKTWKFQEVKQKGSSKGKLEIT